MQNTRICHLVHSFIFFCLEYFHIIQYNTYKLENYVILTYYNTPTEHTPTLQKRKKETWKTTNYSNYKIYHLTGRKITGRGHYNPY